MRLSARLIVNYSNINNFDYATEWNARANEPNQLYFQLVDLDSDGLRYLSPDSGVSVSVIFPAVNNANVITKVASQADARDRSVWSVSLALTEIPNSGNVKFEVTESGVIRRFTVIQGLVVETQNQGGC